MYAYCPQITYGREIFLAFRNVAYRILLILSIPTTWRRGFYVRTV